MQCALCDGRIKGTKHKVPLWGGKGIKTVHVCERCWNKHDNVSEAIMAKKKATKKGKKPEIRPCVHCGRTDFKTDQARRAHQGRCPQKGQTEVKEKKAAKRKKASKKAAKPPKPTKKKAAKKAASKGRKKAVTKTPPPPVEPPKRSPRQAGRMAKAKGNKFENDVKKTLATWWGEPPEVVGSKQSAFQRAPGSGGTSPVNWPLDIHVPEGFPWAVECKNREGGDGIEAMERFFTADKYPLIEWFKTAEKEIVAAGIKKPVLLVFTRNQYPVFAAIRRPGSGVDMLTPACNFMVMLRFPDLELLVAKLDDLLSLSKEEWEHIYLTNNEHSYMPRG